MHIPDGFLGPGTSGALIAAAAGVSAIAVSKIRGQFFIREKVRTLKTPEGAEFEGSTVTKLTKYGQNKIFRMATVGAFIFAAQMVNFPIAQGTSGHLLGGVLAAILLGPWLGFITIAVILIVQSLLFADGGLMALGANIINMGLLGAVGGYYFYNFLANKFKKKITAAFIAAWASVVMASSICAVELAISGTESLSAALPAMAKVHALIGLAEGLITIIVLKGMGFYEKTKK